MAKPKTKTTKPTKATPAPKQVTKAGPTHDEAVKLLEAGDWNGGIAALNVLWTQTRSADLAKEIERLSAHALKSRPALTGEGTELQTAWEKSWATRSPVGLEHLLSVIRSGKADHIRARFDRLRELPADARMNQVVTLFANELHLRSDQTRPIWTAFFKLVGHTGDPRSKATLEKLAKLAKAVKRREGFEEYLIESIAKVVEKLPEAGKYDVSGLRKAIDKLIAKPVKEAAKKATSGDTLYAQVLEDPSDEAARQVWADSLLESGDERGTFVALQLEGERRELTGAEEKQLNKLLAANRLAWLGQAGAVVEPKSATFRFGMLDSAELGKKAKPANLDARELRTATQLYARTPSLLGHPNLVSMKRLGRNIVPNPRSTIGPVGHDYFGPGYDFDAEEAVELAGLGLKGIEHLEFGLPDDLDITQITKAFPDLESVSVSYSWGERSGETFKSLIPWLSKMRDVFFQDIVYSNEADDTWFVDRLPNTNVHFIWGGGELYRSYMRRDGGLHAVYTDTSTKGGFSDGGRRDASWIKARTAWFETVPKVDSLVFRQRSTWTQKDVDAVAERTAKMTNVTLPRASKS